MLHPLRDWRWRSVERANLKTRIAAAIVNAKSPLKKPLMPFYVAQDMLRDAPSELLSTSGFAFLHKQFRSP